MAIYLDHAATAPVRPEVLAAIEPLYAQQFGNPSSIHRWGREARALIETARDQVAAALGANRREIYFTSGGTEADNLALLGSPAATAGGRMVTSAIEHKAVLAAAKHAATLGAEVVVVAVDGDGVLDLDALDHALASAGTATVSVMWANNEIGTVQPVAEIASRCARAGALFHSDAVQAFGRLVLRVDDVPCDLLTISGHKIGGLKGVGALFVRSGVRLRPLVHGGGQERELRPGTENVAGAVALGVAAELAVKERERESERLGALRDELERRMAGALGELSVNGGGAPRVPHIANFAFAGVDQEALLVSLDLEGIAVSSGSACQSGSVEPSHVLLALNGSAAQNASIRVSLGRTTTADEIAQAASKIAGVVTRLRAMAVA